MKKVVIISLAASMILSSCQTSTGTGAYAGSYLGAILGSAIGGINGGPRGSDIGTVIGMAGGAVAGAVIANAAQKAQDERQRSYEEYRQRKLNSQTAGGQYNQSSGDNAYDPSTASDNSGFDPTNSGDDRIVMEPSNGYPTQYIPRTDSIRIQTGTPAHSGEISVSKLEEITAAADRHVQIRHARFYDANNDSVIVSGELCKVSFELYNRSDVPIYNVRPFVTDTTQNKYIRISEPVNIESLLPGKGVRFTASILASKRLRDGAVTLKIGVLEGNSEVTSQTRYITLPTRRQ